MRAFGLELDADFDLPGFGRALLAQEPSRLVRVRKVSPEVVLAQWDQTSAVRLMALEEAPGAGGTTIDRSPDGAYLICSPSFGAFLVASDGSDVACGALTHLDPWYWQAFLSGQVLPAAAVLQGLEIIHASAVSLHGHAFAFHGESGAGKTSLALSLALRGANILADDVVALESHEDHLTAHSGVPVANLIDPEANRLGADDVSRLGEILGAADGISRVALRNSPGERLPLAAVYRLVRVSGDLSESEIIARESDASLLSLVGLTFNTVFRSAERRRAQLDVYATLARHTARYQVSIPVTMNPTVLAGLIEHHAIDQYRC